MGERGRQPRNWETKKQRLTGHCWLRCLHILLWIDSIYLYIYLYVYNYPNKLVCFPENNTASNQHDFGILWLRRDIHSLNPTVQSPCMQQRMPTTQIQQALPLHSIFLHGHWLRDHHGEAVNPQIGGTLMPDTFNLLTLLVSHGYSMTLWFQTYH